VGNRVLAFAHDDGWRLSLSFADWEPVRALLHALAGRLTSASIEALDRRSQTVSDPRDRDRRSRVPRDVRHRRPAQRAPRLRAGIFIDPESRGSLRPPREDGGQTSLGGLFTEREKHAA
jgi:hypothetical protein